MTTKREELRERLFRARVLPTTTVQTKVGQFTIQALTERERSENSLLAMNDKGTLDITKAAIAKVKRIALHLVAEPGGERLLDDSEWEQLRDLDSAVIDQLFDACVAFDGEDDKETEELEKKLKLSWRLRLACRLCLQLGIDDPEQWLEETTPRKLAIWQAFYRVEPWGNDYERSAVTNALLNAVLAMIGATNGQEIKTHGIDDYMPGDWTHRKKPVRLGRKAVQASKNAMAALFPTARQRTK